VVLPAVAGFLLTLHLALIELSAEWHQPSSRVRQARAARNPRDLAAYPSLLCHGHSMLAADDALVEFAGGCRGVSRAGCHPWPM